MSIVSRVEHWERVYKTKSLEEVGWFQKVPSTSINFLNDSRIDKRAKIIDVGGGDSYFVDHLLKEGYENITVLDISETAIKRAKERLGREAEKVNWIVADASNLSLVEKYDFWHDRAAFHFLRDEHHIRNYINILQQSLNKGGTFVVGTFSQNGPKKCSGLEISQYSESSLTEKFGKYFEKIKCINVDHLTPSNDAQNFTFCTFRRL